MSLRIIRLEGKHAMDFMSLRIRCLQEAPVNWHHQCWIEFGTTVPTQRAKLVRAPKRSIGYFGALDEAAGKLRAITWIYPQRAKDDTPVSWYAGGTYVEPEQRGKQECLAGASIADALYAARINFALTIDPRLPINMDVRASNPASLRVAARWGFISEAKNMRPNMKGEVTEVVALRRPAA